MLDLPQLPAGTAQWPPGVAQGAGRLPCGGLCSHGPGDSEGRSGKDSDLAGPEPSTSHFIFCHIHGTHFSLHIHIPHTPFHIPEPAPHYIPHTPVYVLHIPPYPTQSLPRSIVSSLATAHRTLNIPLPSLPYLSQSAHSSLGPHLHIDKGPQVSTWQLQQQLNQGGVGGLHSQMKNCFVALDLLRGEERQRSGQSSHPDPLPQGPKAFRDPVPPLQALRGTLYSCMCCALYKNTTFKEVSFTSYTSQDYAFY